MCGESAWGGGMPVTLPALSKASNLLTQSLRLPKMRALRQQETLRDLPSHTSRMILEDAASGRRQAR
jgi:hypothetical protein